jgi:hypothetical protein
MPTVLLTSLLEAVVTLHARPAIVATKAMLIKIRRNMPYVLALAVARQRDLQAPLSPRTLALFPDAQAW